MNDYVYTTVEEQIEKLKKQQLTIIDESAAMAKLSTYGYYNIINGYRDPYITRLYGEKVYNPGVTFEQIFALFTLDHNLRNAVLLSMIDIEEHLRAVVANIVGKDFGIDHHQYLKKNNYRDKKVSDSYFRRDRILKTLFDLAEKSNKEPIQYYRNKYGYVPPWILLKGALQGAINNSLNEYCHSYPDDISRLEQALGIHIEVKNYIWINRKTQKYHTNPHCSGSINCQKIPFNHAIDLGYVPCKKCCPPHLNE